MTIKQTRLNLVLSLREEPHTSGAEVTTDRSGVLRVTDQEWLESLRRYADLHSFIVIEFTPEHREVIGVYPPKQDLLQYLGDDPAATDSVLVHAMKSPTLYYLRKDHARFVELYGLLQQAYRSHQVAALAVFPGGTQVEDVRLVEGAQ